ncbi:MAG: amidohydrolase family protein [bacterium]
MLIDIHTHFFPDKIADKTIKYLLSEAHGEVKVNGVGTYASLVAYMKRDGVTLSVNQPVATKKEQVLGINRKMLEYNKTQKEVLCFGAMHPDFCDVADCNEEIQFLATNGFKGIKLHPEYQQFYPDDPKMLRIYEACRKAHMIIMFHAGADFAYPDIHATPERLAQVTTIAELQIICAHMGGYNMWEEVIKYLVGKNCWLDTAYSQEMDSTQFAEIIKYHGADKIIFGTDFPWVNAAQIKEKIEKIFPNDIETKEKIYYKNAMQLLGL